MCLKKVIEVAAKSMSDQHIKETLKSLRGGLNEKAGAIIRGTADVSLASSLLAHFHAYTRVCVSL